MITGAISVRGGSRKTMSGSLAAKAGDARVMAAVAEASYPISPNSLADGRLCFSVEKPGAFIIDCDVPSMDIRFQFMNTVKLLKKQLNWTYTHTCAENQTVLDGTLVLNPSNKLSLNYAFNSRHCKVRYSYVYRGQTALEPCYDFAKKSWEFAVSQRILDFNVIRASYDTSSKVLGLEWSWGSLMSKDGSFKISTSFNLGQGHASPRVASVENTWNFDL